MREIDYKTLKVGDPVVTRDGREVRVLCTDRKSKRFPIVALVTTSIGEQVYYYTEKGEFNTSCESALDIFLPPQKEYVVLYKDADGLIHAVIRGFSSKKDAQQGVRDMEFGETKYNIVEIEL